MTHVWRELGEYEDRRKGDGTRECEPQDTDLTDTRRRSVDDFKMFCVKFTTEEQFWKGWRGEGFISTKEPPKHEDGVIDNRRREYTHTYTVYETMIKKSTDM